MATQSWSCYSLSQTTFPDRLSFSGKGCQSLFPQPRQTCSFNFSNFTCIKYFSNCYAHEIFAVKKEKPKD